MDQDENLDENGTPADESADAADADAEDSADAGADKPDKPDESTRRPSRASVLRWVGAAVLVLVLAGSGYEGWLVYQHHQRDVAASQAVDAAKNFILALSDITPNSVEQNFNTVQDGSTGELHDHFSAISEELRQAMIANKAEAHGTVIDAGVVSATKSKVEVMLFVDQSVSNAALPQPMLDRNRLTITMVRVDGRWLASKIDHFELG